jgi:Fur family ferric uptake transcriptional regulator
MRMSRNLKQGNVIQGHVLTTQRRLLLELLRESDEHMDAKELYRRASVRDESISPATVYRSLNLFKQLGLVDEIRLGKVRCRYEIKQSPDHQHLVCQGCGKIMEFKSPLVKKLTNSVRKKYGFNATKIELYLEGYCQKCEDKLGKSVTLVVAGGR